LLHLIIRNFDGFLEDPLSDVADILRFLVRHFPEGITAPNVDGETPYSILQDSNPEYAYYSRLLLMYAARHDPTRDFNGATLRIFNYEARKMALFAFFASTSEWNIFARIRWASDGDSLMRLIVRFL